MFNKLKDYLFQIIQDIHRYAQKSKLFDQENSVLSSYCAHICNIPMMLMIGLHIDYLAQA